MLTLRYLENTNCDRWLNMHSIAISDDRCTLSANLSSRLMWQLDNLLRKTAFVISGCYIVSDHIRCILLNRAVFREKSY